MGKICNSEENFQRRRRYERNKEAKTLPWRAMAPVRTSIRSLPVGSLRRIRNFTTY